jgi:hypothetical protein
MAGIPELKLKIIPTPSKISKIGTTYFTISISSLEISLKFTNASVKVFKSINFVAPEKIKTIPKITLSSITK